MLFNRGPQLELFFALCERGAAAFPARFGPFWLRVGVRVRVGLDLRCPYLDPTIQSAS